MQLRYKEIIKRETESNNRGERWKEGGESVLGYEKKEKIEKIVDVNEELRGAMGNMKILMPSWI